MLCYVTLRYVTLLDVLTVDFVIFLSLQDRWYLKVYHFSTSLLTNQLPYHMSFNSKQSQ
jgi:hypothetical protein